MNQQRTVVLAITGASGVIYAVRLLEVLRVAGCRVHLSISPSAQLVLKQELDVTVDLDRFDLKALLAAGSSNLQSSLPTIDPGEPGEVFYHHHQDMMAPLASGSFPTHGMVICPCSGSTLGAVVHGMGDNLIHRAAQVHLKERRKLIIVPRETPLSTIQLDNMKRISEAGAVVLPASPGFYHGVNSVGDLVDFVVARICDQLGVANALIHRWGT